MILFLLHLGCARNETPEVKPSLEVCDAWKDKVVLSGERIVLCSEKGLTVRMDGMQAEHLAEVWSKQLLAHGYVLEHDLSRPRQIARVYKGTADRLSFAVIESRDETTLSLRSKP